MTCGTKEGHDQWLNTEPFGFICGCMTYPLLGFGSFVVTFKLVGPWLGTFSFMGMLNIVLFNSLVFMSLLSHWKCMTTDPGAVPRDAQPLPTDMHEHDTENPPEVGKPKYRKWCRRCKAFKPSRAHHCSMCGRCIVKMDHHCPWVNNCVAVGNHKLFLLFLLYVNLVCIHALLLIASRYIMCFRERTRERCGTMDTNFYIIFLFVEAVLFGIFTLCMMGDQSTTIWTNQTQIDRLKNVKHDGASAEFNEVLGSPLTVEWDWAWLYPSPVKFPPYPDPRNQAIYGYCLEAKGMEDEEYAPLVSARRGDGSGGDGGDGIRGSETSGNDLELAGSKALLESSSGTSAPDGPILEMSGPKADRAEIRKRQGPP